MNTIPRNFLSAIRRYKMASTLNLLGLSVAYAAFIIIMMQVTFEWTFDRSHPNAGRIVTVVRGKTGANFIHGRGFIDALITSSPHIEAATLYTPINRWIGNMFVTVGDSITPAGYRLPFVSCYADLPRIFGFRFTEGNPDCLSEPDKVIIPLSMARKLFGDKPAVGQTIRPQEYIWTIGMSTMTIGGVYRDLPGNTQLDNVAYASIDDTQKGEWGAMNYLCYLLVDGSIPLKELEADINKTFKFPDKWEEHGLESYVRLEPLTDNYFSDINFKSGNASLVRILFSIALLVIIIAAINFTNFSIALSPMRIRSINTHKILGASTSTLRTAMTCEAVFMSIIAWIASTGIVAWLGNAKALPFIEADTNPLHNIPLMLMTGGVAIASGLIAGLYPAIYTTSFQPALALKGRFALSPAGRNVRMALIGFQFFISIALIISAMFIHLQSSYMKEYNQGFNKEQIAIVYVGNQIYNRNKDTYTNLLKEHPGIADVAFAKQKLGAGDEYMTYSIPWLNQDYRTYTLEVSPNFLRVMDISIGEGRDFLPSDAQSGERSALIMNRNLKERMNAPVGASLPLMGIDRIVAGVTGELKFSSMRQGEDPIVFIVGTSSPLPYSYVRINAGSDLRDAASHIRKSVNAIAPAFPVDIEFYDQVLNDLYRREANLNKSVTLLSIFAIIISIIGVFGMVLFETEYRRREISLRKVYGAGVSGILSMFNLIYLRIVCICFLLAAPVAWYAVTRWLEAFAYKTPLHTWVFLASFMTIAIITALTVTIQNWRAANLNPAESIRSE
jgi:putative ABC transport system permease protein